MNIQQLVGIYYVDGVKRVEFSIKRVMVLTLVFTDFYFVSLFFAKLFRWV